MTLRRSRSVFDADRQKFRQSFIEGDYACPEFESINRWLVEEKIDGTNIRIFWQPSDPVSPTFGGRTKNAQLPTKLLEYLQRTFTRSMLEKQFPDVQKVILFGEGYGSNIQKVGPRYRKDVSFILFDVWIDYWWLQKVSVLEVAKALNIEHPINQKIMSTEEVVDFVKSFPTSYIAHDQTLVMEGVIARAFPVMLFRHHREPIMFKLKVRDYGYKHD